MIIPILDTTFVTINRKLNGYPVSMGDKGHITHRISYLVKSDKLAVLIIYGYQICFLSLLYFHLFWFLVVMVILTIPLLIQLTQKTNHFVWPVND